MGKIRLVQIQHPQHGRRIALVEEPQLVLLEKFKSIYELALEAIDTGQRIPTVAHSVVSAEKLSYDAVYNGEDPWQLLPSFDHPDGPFACMVSGTGLTHKNSALNRQMMHQSTTDKPTDSIQIYEWGVQGGSPAKGEIGVQPEWFYKGNGSMLRGHAQELNVPIYADDGGEEPELAGAYVVDRTGRPWRIGLTIGNEFSDHIMEKKNYLYLAPSKLRNCAIGPELVIDADFEEYKGKVGIKREGKLIWASDLKSGERNMSHNLANLEHHHFKYASHRIPFQVHIHFFGADAFSFGSQIALEQGDMMEIQWDGLGRPLRNKIDVTPGEETLISISSI